MEALLRRHRDTLIIVGRGNLMFGIWGVIRTVMTYVLQSSEREQIVASFRESEGYDPAYEPIYYLIFFLFMFVVVAAEMWARLYICRSARAEGMGQKKGCGYLIVAGIVIVISTAVYLVNIRSGYYSDMDTMDMAVTMVIELTSVVMLSELIVSAIRVRQLSRKLERGG